jgi:hypothetical protein
MRALDDPAHSVGAGRTGQGEAQGTGRVPWVGLHGVIRLAAIRAIRYGSFGEAEPARNRGKPSIFMPFFCPATALRFQLHHCRRKISLA